MGAHPTGDLGVFCFNKRNFGLARLYMVVKAGDRMDYESCMDNFLMSLVVDADSAALNELAIRHQEKAYALALSLLKSHEDAEDAVQDAWLLVLENKDAFDMGAAFFPWFSEIVRNRCLNALERRTKKPDAISLDGLIEHGFDVALKTISPDDRMAKEELFAAVRNAVSRLGPQLRLIVQMRFMEDKSLKEIGRKLHCHPSTVKRRLQKALRQLELMLRSDYNDYWARRRAYC